MPPPLDTPRDQSHRDDDTPRTEAVIDLDAIKANLAQIKARTSAEVMAIVKADGYGHGLVPAARAAVAGGATWLGTAIVTEAITLREAGLKVPVFAWLWTPGEGSTIRRAITADVDLSISSTWQLAAILSAVAETGCPARIHLKIDTGLSRNGSYFEDWPDLVLGRRQSSGSCCCASRRSMESSRPCRRTWPPDQRQPSGYFRPRSCRRHTRRRQPTNMPSRQLGRDPHDA
jgi:D-serine deaminase-like pyridoxal phosphate-dependent protein